MTSEVIKHYQAALQRLIGKPPARSALKIIAMTWRNLHGVEKLTQREKYRPQKHLLQKIKQSTHKLR